MKRAVIFLILCAASATSGLAQQGTANAPATREDIERYLSAIHSHDMMNQMAAAMSKPIHQMVHDEYLKDKDKLPADFEDRTNKMTDDMFKEMPFDEMMQAMVPVYQKHFTKGDIDALVAFYSSPTGQKTLRELPAIMSEAMESAIPIMQKYMETMKQRIDEETAKALKESEKRSN